MKVTDKKGREFYIEQEEDLIYVGNKALFSNMAAQLVLGQILEGCESIQFHDTYTNLEDDYGNLIVGVGFKILRPYAIQEIKEVLENYE